ncbi:TatD family hydrolase [Kribbella solani]|uniref:TatD DNase family protein n=1 Tax=Kribbella solani TaxID=236067 RepID=A0A841DZB8_9ACTN|nr:TatD family hydrolase [Kribbella solani]MBB5983321.1 TatD DNase family protein [Kribbella solani]MDX3004185.1 TatD family hydrolase [Kribbella solani]
MAADGVEVGRPTRERAGVGEDGRVRDRKRPAVPDPLPVSVVDAHCHLDIADGEDGDWLGAAEAIRLASSVGVTRIVQVGCDLPGAVWAVEAAAQYPNLIAGVALHPNEAPKLKAAGELDSALAEIERLAASSDKVRVIGETGLDYFRTGADGQAAQHESFAAHIELAKRLGKTLMIHDRDAHDDILRILDREGVPDRLVMHCFSGDTEFARECVNRGAYLSFAGVVTFKNAQSLRDALAVTPIDRILVETDAPYLTPSPYRGKPNASYLIPHTVRRMADVLNISTAELCAALNTNADNAFGGSW